MNHFHQLNFNPQLETILNMYQLLLKEKLFQTSVNSSRNSWLNLQFYHIFYYYLVISRNHETFYISTKIILEIELTRWYRCRETIIWIISRKDNTIKIFQVSIRIPFLDFPTFMYMYQNGGEDNKMKRTLHEVLTMENGKNELLMKYACCLILFYREDDGFRFGFNVFEIFSVDVFLVYFFLIEKLVTIKIEHIIQKYAMVQTELKIVFWCFSKFFMIVYFPMGTRTENHPKPK